MRLYVKTPLIDMLDFCGGGRTVRLKMEAYQPTGSFKLRGIENLCVKAIGGGAAHLISSSGGNAGLSVAYAGRKLGVEVTVVVPETTPSFMVERIEREEARTLVYGEAWDDAHRYALSMAEDGHAAYIPPFDHPALWEGHASMVDELKEECGQPDLIVLSVGGGGLLCGIVEGIVRNQWADTHILAVETAGAASLYESCREKRMVTLDRIESIATSLGAKRVAERALEYAQRYHITPCLVEDGAAARACHRFANEYRVLVEPACGASLSVIYDGAGIVEGYRNIVVIVCGGALVNLEKMDQWREEYPHT